MTQSELYNEILRVIHTTEDNNSELINYIESHKNSWQGPKLIDEKSILRTVGPEPEMLNFESTTEFNSKVDKIIDWLKQNQDGVINLLCEKHDDLYYLLDGNHRFEAFKKLGYKKFSVIYVEDSVIHQLLNQKQ